MTPGGELLRVFLSGGGFPERGAGRPGAVAVAELTSPLSLSSCHHFHNGPSFHPGPRERLLTTPEELPSFHERGQAPSSFHRFRRSFRLRLIDWRYHRRAEASAADEVGLSPVNVVGHFVQVTPPTTLTVPMSYPSIDTEESRSDSQGFIRLRSLAYQSGRNVTPPRLSSPGPSDAGCYLPTLAAYPLSRFE